MQKERGRVWRLEGLIRHMEEVIISIQVNQNQVYILSFLNPYRNPVGSK